jgi:hypothetical protein
MINDLSYRLGIENKGKVYRIMRSVLHTVRDCITTEESMKLMAKLPFFAKVVFEENWEARYMKDLPKPKTIHEFIEQVKDNHGKMFLAYDFANNAEIEYSCRMVLGLIKELTGGCVATENLIPMRIDKLFSDISRFKTINGFQAIKQISLN